jgi:hypothetical protein
MLSPIIYIAIAIILLVAAQVVYLIDISNTIQPDSCPLKKEEMKSTTMPLTQHINE